MEWEVRSTEKRQKEMGGKAREQQEDPTGNKTGVPRKVMAGAKLHF